MWGKKKIGFGKWLAHHGNFDDFFDYDYDLKKCFLKSVFDTFNDGNERYFVPEVNSRENDFHAIVKDMENLGTNDDNIKGFTFI